MNEQSDFRLEEFLEYLKSTQEKSWCEKVTKTKDGRKCVLGHVFDFGRAAGCSGNYAMDMFEEIYATSYMMFLVNDGDHPDYPQPTPKQRCISYFTNMMNGKEKTTQQLWKEHELSVLINNHE